MTFKYTSINIRLVKLNICLRQDYAKPRKCSAQVVTSNSIILFIFYPEKKIIKTKTSKSKRFGWIQYNTSHKSNIQGENLKKKTRKGSLPFGLRHLNSVQTCQVLNTVIILKTKLMLKLGTKSRRIQFTSQNLLNTIILSIVILYFDDRIKWHSSSPSKFIISSSLFD